MGEPGGRATQARPSGRLGLSAGEARRMTRRRGISLIEVLVVIHGTAILLGLAVYLIEALVSSERLGQAELLEARRLANLSDEFRRDVRAARQADRVAVESK